MLAQHQPRQLAGITAPPDDEDSEEDEGLDLSSDSAEDKEPELSSDNDVEEESEQQTSPLKRPSTHSPISARDNDEDIDGVDGLLASDDPVPATAATPEQGGTAGRAKRKRGGKGGGGKGGSKGGAGRGASKGGAGRGGKGGAEKGGSRDKQGGRIRANGKEQQASKRGRHGN